MMSCRCVFGSARTRAAWAAFTLIELLVVIAVIGVLAGTLLGVLARAQANSRSVQCVSNLRQWGVALNLYANDNNGAYPRRGQGVQPLFQVQRPEDWFNALPPYAGQLGLQDALTAGKLPRPGEHSIFVCPAAAVSSAGQYFLPYAMNIYLSPWNRPLPHTRTNIENSSQLAFLTDGPVAWSSTTPSREAYSVQPRHNRRANVCFVDGHVVSFDGAYLGCGMGEPKPACPDVHWYIAEGTLVPFP